MKTFNFLLALLLVVAVGKPSFAQQKTIPKPPNVDRYEFKLLPQVAQTETDYTVVKEDFTVTLRDGVIMDCSKFYPSEANIYLPDGYPVVIMVHGYGDSKLTLENFANAQAQYNYVVYTYSVRGQGNSGGLSNLMSIVEAQDLMELVTYVRNDHVGGDTSKISLTGGSQGGTVPYIAACNGMQVKGIISALTSPKFATSWIENGSVKMTYLWTIEYTSDTARYNPLVDRMSDWVYASGQRSDKWDSLAYWMPIGRDFSNKVQNNTTPLLVENSWQDYFFNAKDGINSFSNVNPEHIVYLGAVMGHGGDISASENAWHMNFFNDWYFHNVWGWASNYATYNRYQYAFTTHPKVGNDWSFEHGSSAVWPPAGMENVKFYLGKNNKLKTSTESSILATTDLKNTVKNNYTLQQAVYSAFDGTEFKNKFKKDSVYFQSDALSQPTYMIGTPKIKLTYLTTGRVVQYNYQIYEVTNTGKVNFVTRANFTDRKSSLLELTETVTFDGQAHAHKFQQGSKIRIVITNLDTTPEDRDFLGTNPFVLPVMDNNISLLFLKGSYVELPLVNGLDNNTSFNPTVELRSPTLHQNYPNPFNPTTNIKFELPAEFTGNVSLKIYDMVGKEIATLVNGNLTEGIHEFQWNASQFASGVYFSKLIAGNNVEIKRMILVK